MVKLSIVCEVDRLQLFDAHGLLQTDAPRARKDLEGVGLLFA